MASFIQGVIEVPLAVIFVTHVLTNVKLDLLSRCLNKAWLFIRVLAVFGVCLLAAVVYMEYFA